MSEDYIRELTELSIYFYETTKFKNIDMAKKIPILFELGLFSKAFLILDSIMKSKDNFLAKKDLEELRRIMKPNKLQESLCKAFCILFRQAPQRKRK